MRKRIILLVCLPVMLLQGCPVAQEARQQVFQVMFYNVENLFDTYDDPHTSDNEFLPEGTRHWTPYRYYTHLRQTARVIHAAGEWDTPALVGLCEVENDSVLIHLTRRTSLRMQNYSYCITGSRDPRGINVALLYQEDKFRYLEHRSKRIPFKNKARRSRDILHVSGRVITGDTLDVFVCHFPSRRGGEKMSEPFRLEAASYLRRLCDSIHAIRRTPNILIMGDFNDMPADRSIQTIICSTDAERNFANLFADAKKLNHEGSYKYRGEWNQLDQIMINRSWERYYRPGSAQIFAPDFLLTGNRSRNRQRPLRVFNGSKYEGGFSDHLPVVAYFLLPVNH
ncbi:MAG: endonuclease [Tannerella sp.]|jgi:predicted extracellular nuclease|nr:endonuclease [Tannerella sp.]